MTDRKQHLANEASRLLNDEVLASAFHKVRLDALVGLGTVDPTDTKEIMRLQAIAACLQEVRDLLQTAIIATGDMDGGVDPNGPTA
ncbi:hypothetical protein [Pelagibacterium luteolum]|uniref:Uncharacterized protein n=1 Tax=Pelagibacterium luteolum TaxID=440168 RepID=A0A1G7TJ88_9HYPH|nr:hypothetical protein [Pelagibacterium luteolum]SDG34719.1 hypothetical protein SAMN04487974_102131 [Pelagibacterium luteolum]